MKQSCWRSPLPLPQMTPPLAPPPMQHCRSQQHPGPTLSRHRARLATCCPRCRRGCLRSRCQHYVPRERSSSSFSLHSLLVLPNFDVTVWQNSCNWFRGKERLGSLQSWGLQYRLSLGSRLQAFPTVFGSLLTSVILTMIIKVYQELLVIMTQSLLTAVAISQLNRIIFHSNIQSDQILPAFRIYP